MAQKVTSYDVITFLSRIYGAELIQICLGFNEVILRFFPGNISITVLDPALFYDLNPNLWANLHSPDVKLSPFGKTLVNSMQTDNNSLNLYLSNQDIIAIKTDPKALESVVLMFEDEIYVV